MSGSAPSESRVDLIRRLCGEWCAAASQPGGGMVIGQVTEQLRLNRNGIVFHELTHEELQAACVGLARVLLRSGLNTVVDQDHLLLWSWLAQLLVSRSGGAGADREVRELLSVCVRAALAPTRPPTTDRYALQVQRQIDDLIPFHLRWFGMQSHVVLAYLSFPALEGVLKLACGSFVDLSGKAVVPFSVPARSGGGTNDYGPSSGRPQCSSLRDLLLLHHASVAVDPLRARVQEIRDHLASLQPATDGFDLLYDWRNSSLHGAASYPTIGGTVLTLALLIALEGVKADFETSRAAAWQGVEWELRTGADSRSRSPWSFYPPY